MFKGMFKVHEPIAQTANFRGNEREVLDLVTWASTCMYALMKRPMC